MIIYIYNIHMCICIIHIVYIYIYILSTIDISRHLLTHTQVMAVMAVMGLEGEVERSHIPAVHIHGAATGGFASRKW